MKFYSTNKSDQRLIDGFSTNTYTSRDNYANEINKTYKRFDEHTSLTNKLCHYELKIIMKADSVHKKKGIIKTTEVKFNSTIIASMKLSFSRS